MGNQILAARLHQKRIALGLTQEDIASQIGVAISTVQRYEAGTIGKIKLPVVEAIARVLGVNPSWLIGKTDCETPPASLLGKEASPPLDELEQELLRLTAKLTPEQKRRQIDLLKDILGKQDT